MASWLLNETALLALKLRRYGGRIVTTKADTYRQKAEDCLRAAARVSNPAAKAMWLEMAQQCLVIATSRYRRMAADPKPDSKDGARDQASCA
jgi:hypothetical protein